MLSEYVIRGNAAVLKCNIPSFVADFVRVEAWLGDDGSVYNMTKNEFGIFILQGFHLFLCSHLLSLLFHLFFNFSSNKFCFTVVSQYYLSEAENEYVIRGNSVILKCKIPSFVADFVTVEAWLDEEGHEFNNSINGDIS